MRAPLPAAAIALLLLAAVPSARAAPVPVSTALLDAGAAAGRGSDAVEMLALRRVFQTLGMRFDVVTDASRLSDYSVVFTAGALPNSPSAAALSNDLYDFVEAGGTLVSTGEVGTDMYRLFGISKQVPSRSRYRLSFAGHDPSLAYVEGERERTISLGNGQKKFFENVIWSHGATLASETAALGVFDDGSVGFSVHGYGRGRAYLLGVSCAESVLLPQAGGSYNAERQYVNGIEPSADVIMLILTAIAEAGSAVSVCVSPVPYARPTALVLTHDVDAQTSFLDSLKFAALEKKFGVTSTFFITTKYFTDSTDTDYFNAPENVDAVRRLKAQGWDIGSHTVSHLPALGTAPEGDPGVTRATYDPRKGITVWGEVRVSKELLDREIPGQRTTAYRSGDLAFPRSLIRVLEGAGYRYDSTYSANAVLTAFPYFALREQSLGSPESTIVEIPVTLDDSQGYLTPANVDAAVKGWLEVIRANARYEGTTVLLMHPSDTRTRTYKLRAQEDVMREAAAMGAWMGNLSAMGKFWRDRASLRWSLDSEGSGASGAAGGLIIRVDARADELDPAIGFSVSGRVDRVRVTDRDGKPLDFRAQRRGGKLYLSQAPR